MKGLPATWVVASIADVTLPFVSINPAKSPDRVFRYVDIGSIDNATQTITEPKTVTGREAPSRARRVISSGDTLFSTVRTYLKNIALVSNEFDGELTSTGIAVLRPSDAVHPRYLFRWACSDEFVTPLSHTQDGTMYPAVSDNDVTGAPIPLPPLSEQQRIVTKLDSLLGRSKRARDHLDHLPRLAENYKQAVLDAAFRGDLTIGWSNGRRDWSEAKLADVCSPGRPITYGVIKLGDEVANGVPCLRTSNVRRLRIDLRGIRSISKALSNEYHRTVLSGGEVLVNVRGTLGGVAVAPVAMAGWNVSREVAVAPVDPEKVLPQYAAYWIAASASQSWLIGVERGVAYTGINIEDLRKLPVVYPELAEQHEIVRRIETAFAWIDRLSSDAAGARTLINHLDRAILAKAFRGELVPQDSKEEPAGILLEQVSKRQQSRSPRPPRRRRRAVTL